MDHASSSARVLVSPVANAEWGDIRWVFASISVGPRPARAQFEEVRSIIVAGHVGRRELFDLELAASMVAEEVVRVAAQAHEAGRTPGTGGVTAPRAVNALRDEHLRSWAWAVSAMAGTEGFR